MHIEEVAALLGRKQIPGSPQEREVLCTRIADLARNNGVAWVEANRDRLLREWETILRMKTIR